MPTNQRIPAAQYVRMSTEHQQYSIENQSNAIHEYAEAHNFDIVRTYSDAARSGVVLRRRAGLQKLLQDVVGADCCYRAILVYDVSRWGRFQDTDESAHYEFLCKSAGVPVHYCAETFSNDGTLPSLIMKALKRTMAGEYSRELGVKVLEGQKRLARLGFKQGGMPGYGFRRLLISPSGTPKQELLHGDRKSIATDRVVLFLGPVAEVETVRFIYRMLVNEGKSVSAIARELNHRGIEYTGLSQWDYQAVYTILTHPKYTGCHVFGRTSCKLYTPSVKLPKSQWILRPGAFESIIDVVTFEKAQTILERRTIHRTDEELLESLRRVLAAEGKLSLQLIQDAPGMASPSTYRHRFGGLRAAYQQIGYGSPEQFGPFDLRRRTLALRAELISQIAAIFPDTVSVIRRGARWRARLRIRNGPIVSVLVARSVVTDSPKKSLRWCIAPVRRECRFVTLLARLSAGNQSFLDFSIFPHMARRGRFLVPLNDAWLNTGTRLPHISRFRDIVMDISRQSNHRNFGVH